MRLAEATAIFAFDCPACRERLSITAEERGQAVQCPHCATVLPGPDFPVRGVTARGAIRGWIKRGKGGAVRTDGRHGGRPLQRMGGEAARRAGGGALYRTAGEAPEWERWRRPVAKVFNRHDLLRSLQHWLMDGRRVGPPDEELSDRERRRFEFYCGACGHMQQARVWDIALQADCTCCGLRLIVPAPRWGRDRPWPGVEQRREGEEAGRVDEGAARGGKSLEQAGEEAGRAGEGAGWVAMGRWPRPRVIGLWCPRCGLHVPGADRTRTVRTNCPRCGEVF